MKYLKQVRIVNQDYHQRYLKDFFEEPLNFEEYINFELGQLFDEQLQIESISFIALEAVAIIYKKTI